MKQFKLLLSLLLLFPVSAFALAEGARFSASLHESHWGSTGSRTQCTLFHEIPAYGKALFAWSAGGQLTFSLRPKLRTPEVKEVRLTSSAPPWKHDRADESLLHIPTVKGRSGIDLEGKYSLHLLDEITKGMSPTFDYIDPMDGEVKMQVELSPVWLRPALGEFQSCVANLLSFNYEQIRRSKLHFDFGSSRLTPEALERANQIAEFLLAEEGVRRVRIEGHTDDVGRFRYNKNLGKRRAEVVKNCLIGKGVDAKRIIVMSRGERRPDASNNKEAGRAKNRRVVIILDR